jgi:hypothetical protein
VRVALYTSNLLESGTTPHLKYVFPTPVTALLAHGQGAKCNTPVFRHRDSILSRNFLLPGLPAGSKNIPSCQEFLRFRQIPANSGKFRAGILQEYFKFPNLQEYAGIPAGIPAYSCKIPAKFLQIPANSCRFMKIPAILLKFLQMHANHM